MVGNVGVGVLVVGFSSQVLVDLEQNFEGHVAKVGTVALLLLVGLLLLGNACPCHDPSRRGSGTFVILANGPIRANTGRIPPKRRRRRACACRGSRR
jgi:hypothetical protein